MSDEPIDTGRGYRVRPARFPDRSPWRTTAPDRPETPDEFAARIGVGEHRTGGTTAPTSPAGTTRSTVYRFDDKSKVTTTETWGGRRDVTVGLRDAPPLSTRPRPKRLLTRSTT